MDHILYLDDSGTRGYRPSPDQYGRDGESRYFVFGGFIISQEASGRFSGAIAALKVRRFGTASVEIKSNWIRIPKERTARYLVPFNLTDDEFDAFLEDYYGAIAAADVELMACVVDKVHMQEDYATPWLPHGVAYDAVMQRAQNCAVDRHGSYRVLMDDTTGKNPKGNEYKALLYRLHERMRKSGSSMRKGFEFTALRDPLRFVNSGTSHLVQVADIVAYNVNRQFMDHGEDWEQQGLGQLEVYEPLGRLAQKFRQGPNGRIQGFGIVKMPRRGRVPWGVPIRREAAP